MNVKVTEILAKNVFVSSKKYIKDLGYLVNNEE